MLSFPCPGVASMLQARKSPRERLLFIWNEGRSMNKIISQTSFQLKHPMITLLVYELSFAH